MYNTLVDICYALLRFAKTVFKICCMIFDETTYAPIKMDRKNYIQYKYKEGNK